MQLQFLFTGPQQPRAKHVGSGGGGKISIPKKEKLISVLIIKKKSVNVGYIKARKFC